MREQRHEEDALGAFHEAFPVPSVCTVLLQGGQKGGRRGAEGGQKGPEGDQKRDRRAAH